MPTTNVQGINDFMSAVGGILAGPSAKDVVAASVMGAQRNNYEAEAAKRRMETQEIAGYVNSAQGMRDMLASGYDPSDPNQRSAFVGKLLGMRDGLQYGPQAAARASTFVNPNFVGPQDLSTIMSGALGMDYANTPYGFGVDQQRQMEEARAKDLTVQRGQDINSADARYKTDTEGRVSITNNQLDNETKRYGYDVGSGDARYKVDTEGRISSENNVRDNATKMQMNEGDNLARIITGQGQDAATIERQKIANEGAYNVQNLRETAENERLKQGLGSSSSERKPSTVSPQAADNFVDLSARALRSQIMRNAKDPTGLDMVDLPQPIVDMVAVRAADIYQQTGDAIGAVNQAAEEFMRSNQGAITATPAQDGWISDTPASVSVDLPQILAPNAPPAPPSAPLVPQTPAPQAPTAPAAQAPAAQPPAAAAAGGRAPIARAPAGTANGVYAGSDGQPVEVIDGLVYPVNPTGTR